MYRITNQRYTDTTIDAVRRGVPVRLIHEPQEYRNPARQWDSWNVDRLYMAGVQIKMRKHLGLNHQKSVVLYGQGPHDLRLFKLDRSSSNSQQEHNYFTTKPWFFQWFVDQFERKWNSTTENEPFVPLAPGEPTYIAPANAAVAQPTTLRCAGKVDLGHISMISTSAQHRTHHCLSLTPALLKAAPWLVNRFWILVRWMMVSRRLLLPITLSVRDNLLLASRRQNHGQS